jgi:hypothetical protein
LQYLMINKRQINKIRAIPYEIKMRLGEGERAG